MLKRAERLNRVGVKLRDRDRDLAFLARGGFGFDIAVKVVDAETVEELEG